MTELDYLLTGDPADRITWRGHTTTGGRDIWGSRRTVAHLEHTNEQAREKYGTDLVIFQGAYNTTVSASAGSHDGDAAIDLYIPGVDWWEQQRFLRELGWAAWYRHTGSFADNQHIHMISLGYPARVGYLIPGQVVDYYNRRDGLAGHSIDDTWHPADIDSTIFDYSAWKAGLDMFEDADRKTLNDLRAAVTDLAAAEKARAQEAAGREERRFANLRVILKERFNATDADLDELIGHLKP